IHLANILGQEINKKDGLTGENALGKLDTQSFLEMPATFQRILYAIDPALLQEALQCSVIDSGKLRVKMALVEALSVQWMESRYSSTMTVGDTVMRLAAYGINDDEIFRIIEKMKNDNKGAEQNKTPAGIAIQSIRRFTDDWRTQTKRVYSRMHKPGYGAIS